MARRNHARERACCFVGKTHKWVWYFVDLVEFTDSVRNEEGAASSAPMERAWQAAQPYKNPLFPQKLGAAWSAGGIRYKTAFQRWGRFRDSFLRRAIYRRHGRANTADPA